MAGHIFGCMEYKIYTSSDFLCTDLVFRCLKISVGVLYLSSPISTNMISLQSEKCLWPCVTLW